MISTMRFSALAGAITHRDSTCGHRRGTELRYRTRWSKSHVGTTTRRARRPRPVSSRTADSENDVYVLAANNTQLSEAEVRLPHSPSDHPTRVGFMMTCLP